MHGFERLDKAQGGLRIVSFFEAAKGLIVLVAGFGVLAFIHEDMHQVAKELVRHFHLNPASHYPHIFIKAAQHWTDGQLWVMAGSALLYAVVRFVEAFGLWFQRQWAAWFGLLSGGAYVPIELFEITRGVTWPKVTLLMVNAGVVGYLGYVLARSKRGCPARKAQKQLKTEKQTKGGTNISLSFENDSPVVSLRKSPD